MALYVVYQSTRSETVDCAPAPSGTVGCVPAPSGTVVGGVQVAADLPLVLREVALLNALLFPDALSSLQLPLLQGVL